MGIGLTHLLQVINDVRDLSKIEAGKMRPERTESALDELLGQCLDVVADAARDKGLALLQDTARLCGDPTRLRQALLNVLTNAVTFTQPGSVRRGGDLLQTVAGRCLVRFDVSDTGEGIASDAQPHLFTAFEQADASISRRRGGTGLGLAMARHLAQLMGGEVGVDSTPGHGSRFWFTAWLGCSASACAVCEPGPRARPVAAATPVAAGADAVLRRHHAGRRVLLAEDNPVNQNVAPELLRAAGLAATRAFRTRLGAALPIIAMTANAFGEDRDACLAAGMNDHIAKPVDPAHLYRTLLRWLGAGPGR